MPHTVTINISARGIALLLAAVAAVWLLVTFDQLVLVLFISTVLAVALDPTVDRLERRRVPRWLAIVLLYVLLLGIVALVVGLLLPVVIVELSQLSATLPSAAQSLVNRSRIWLVTQVPALGPALSADGLSGQLSSQLGTIAGSAGTMVLAFGSAFTTIIINTLLILVVAFLLSADPRFAPRVIARFFPPRTRPTVTALAQQIGWRLGHWVRAQALVGLFFGVTFGLGLALLRVPYWFSLAVAAAVLEFIPYVGGATVAVIAMLVAFTVAPWLPVAVLCVYLLVASIESNIVYPKLVGEIVGLHPLVVIVALFIGVAAKGVLGALLAVPVMVVLQVAFDHFYRFGDPPTEEASTSGAAR